jgi:hypothetical protein
MLEAFAAAASARGIAHEVVAGSWPEAADDVDMADVVVCHNVAYGVADLVPFVAALRAKARRRVVIELTAEHPLAPLNPLWKALHDLDRPAGPTAEDAAAVLVEMGLPVAVERSTRRRAAPADPVAAARHRLCVGPDRDAEIAALLTPEIVRPARNMFALWWDTGPAAEG